MSLMQNVGRRWTDDNINTEWSTESHDLKQFKQTLSLQRSEAMSGMNKLRAAALYLQLNHDLRSFYCSKLCVNIHENLFLMNLLSTLKNSPIQKDMKHDIVFRNNTSHAKPLTTPRVFS